MRQQYVLFALAVIGALIYYVPQLRALCKRLGVSPLVPAPLVVIIYLISVFLAPGGSAVWWFACGAALVAMIIAVPRGTNDDFTWKV